jgi:phenylacetic acid degradation operon negative regulatory protein
MPSHPATGLPEALLAEPPRAGAFIVTVYGDVVLPRGGVLWMGNLIETCAAQGLSESLVRTAVSRLVAAGQLQGERVGRRSFYRLTPRAAEEYVRASMLVFAPPPPARGWRLALGPLPEALAWPWVRLGPEAALAPDANPPALPGCETLVTQDGAGPAGFCARHWPLDAVAEGYNRLIDRFADISGAPDGATALALRLRLVHLYRQPALLDPRLPRRALPVDWPRDAARRVFVRLYRVLSDAADAHVTRTFRDSTGPMPTETGEMRDRIRLLDAEVEDFGLV